MEYPVGIRFASLLPVILHLINFLYNEPCFEHCWLVDLHLCNGNHISIAGSAIRCFSSTDGHKIPGERLESVQVPYHKEGKVFLYLPFEAADADKEQ
jgi:hypothetical protein